MVGLLFPATANNFFSSTVSRSAQKSIQPPIQLAPASLSLGIKQTRNQAVHSPLTSAEIKDGEAIPPLPISLHGVAFN
jgi:hypothetical protein